MLIQDKETGEMGTCADFGVVLKDGYGHHPYKVYKIKSFNPEEKIYLDEMIGYKIIYDTRTKEEIKKKIQEFTEQAEKWAEIDESVMEIDGIGDIRAYHIHFVKL